jgi:hypothetical protein
VFSTRHAELNKVLKSIDDGTYVELSKQTISEYLDRWLTTVKPNLAAKTFERYKQVVTVNINPKLGPIKLTKLHPLQIAEKGPTASRHLAIPPHESGRRCRGAASGREGNAAD